MDWQPYSLVTDRAYIAKADGIVFLMVRTEVGYNCRDTVYITVIPTDGVERTNYQRSTVRADFAKAREYCSRYSEVWNAIQEQKRKFPTLGPMVFPTGK
ncbi:hypothetical protein Pla110_44130 [Polystyrenella longa]|uniref:Uncharacterized protein n=1 Tax=Polystyrenella longa TaxID=2528007 RepID=A0A518CTV0_9PLAN|nr:hypothetical protein Pla110_44130 [Polystyrenella longa]